MYNDNTIDTLLRQVCKAHTNKINQTLDQYNMHKGQPLLLYLLCKEDGIPQSTLAREMAIKPATVSAMVKRMEKTGFVKRKRDAEDERVSNVYITEAGIAVMKELDKMQKDMDTTLLEGFSNKETENLRILLKRVLSNIID